ncbi:unnamed protein product, partial [Mesorhabditis belari]|uniref:Bestrophin homolog n=1 Tax=Mesorhabditis belari TaxID=2138241 RepID=A0AAF3FRG3_9BILA
MTVSYNLAVSSVGSLTWARILFRWRGSIWKSVSSELFTWLILYYIVMFIYRSDFFLTTEQRKDFESLAYYLNKNTDRLPLTFMLGFFVTLVVDRWRQVFNNMGWIENQALTIATLIRGNDHETITTRRAIVRYICLTQVLVFRDISMRVRRRFPTMNSIVDAGFLQEHEVKMLDQIEVPYNKYWAPINWAMGLVYKAREQNKITSEPSLQNVLNEIKAFRSSLQLLSNFDWVPIPLAYPQVVFFAVRVYFYLCLVGRQFRIVDDSDIRSPIDMYFPVTTALQFICLIGWMKVAESLLNPMGEDDDDFECNYLIDKNIATGMAIVDEEYDQLPEIKMDTFKTNWPPKPPINEGELVGSVSQVILPEATDPPKGQDQRKASQCTNSSEFGQSRLQRLKSRMRLRSFKRANSIHVDNLDKLSPAKLQKLDPNAIFHVRSQNEIKDLRKNTTPDTVVEEDEEQLTITSLKGLKGQTRSMDMIVGGGGGALGDPFDPPPLDRLFPRVSQSIHSTSPSSGNR